MCGGQPQTSLIANTPEDGAACLRAKQIEYPALASSYFLAELHVPDEPQEVL
jgi:hypothetical protein